MLFLPSIIMMITIIITYHHYHDHYHHHHEIRPDSDYSLITIMLWCSYQTRLDYLGKAIRMSRYSPSSLPARRVGWVWTSVLLLMMHHHNRVAAAVQALQEWRPTITLQTGKFLYWQNSRIHSSDIYVLTILLYLLSSEYIIMYSALYLIYLCGCRKKILV